MNYQHIAPVYSYAAADKRPEAGFVIPDFGYNRAFYCPEQQQMHPAPFAQYPQYYPQYYPQVNYPLVVAHHQYSDFKLANVVYPKRPRSIQLPLPRKKPKIVPPKKVLYSNKAVSS